MFLQSVTIYLVLSLSGHFDWSFTITTSTTVRHQQLIFQHESSEKEEEGKKTWWRKISIQYFFFFSFLVKCRHSPGGMYPISSAAAAFRSPYPAGLQLPSAASLPRYCIDSLTLAWIKFIPSSLSTLLALPWAQLWHKFFLFFLSVTLCHAFSKWKPNIFFFYYYYFLFIFF